MVSILNLRGQSCARKLAFYNRSQYPLSMHANCPLSGPYNGVQNLPLSCADESTATAISRSNAAHHIRQEFSGRPPFACDVKPSYMPLARFQIDGILIRSRILIRVRGPQYATTTTLFFYCIDSSGDSSLPTPPRDHARECCISIFNSTPPRVRVKSVNDVSDDVTPPALNGDDARGASRHGTAINTSVGVFVYG
ncbi:hypothetical protein EVAR_43887_1 [Eumeta japonica]|uniref:Uncharacterized protein n=1 Tax=Eumeta variegata TaxID=151549 RepID=A0A4C1WMK4_EUMVA|nr:hypothetical protein EVAR_43887_1 [Eumeta japonica]